MSFDENSTAFLMGILTDLYSDPALAVIREYSTNAWDSHVEAGRTDRPIEITLPNQLANTFMVQDYGVGMSIDQLKQQFSKYGWSSKRDTDEQTGSLGLGCKSALSYTSQFTLVSRHNGTVATVLITREEDGAGTVQILHVASTIEPNGVTIKVPVHNITQFNRKAEEFFSFWSPGMALVNGQDIGGKWFEKVDTTHGINVAVDPDVTLATNLPNNYLIMGNVPYVIDEAKLPPFGTYRVVMRVPIGTVNFTPNREALHYTKRTMEVVDEASNFIIGALKSNMQARLDAAPTKADAIATHQAIEEGIRKTKSGYYAGQKAHADLNAIIQNLTYRGDRIPRYFDGGIMRKVETSRSYYGGTRSWAVAGTLRMTEVVKQRLIVTGLKGHNLSSAFYSRLDKWMEDYIAAHPMPPTSPQRYGGPFGSFIYAVDCVPHKDWFDPEHTMFITMEEIRAIELPKEQRGPVIKKEPRERYTLLGNRGPMDLRNPKRVDQVKHPLLAWVEATISNEKFYSKALLSSAAPAYSIANVQQRDIKAFIRENPGIPHVSEWIVQEHTRRLNQFGGVQADRVLRQVTYDGVDTLASTIKDPAILADPELREMVTIIQMANNAPRKWDSYEFGQFAFLATRLGLSNLTQVTGDTPSYLPAVRRLLRRYPLMGLINNGYGRVNMSELIEILNLQYHHKYAPKPPGTALAVIGPDFYTQPTPALKGPSLP